MRHIKLFEGFESNLISSTLAYVKDKSRFFNILKDICDNYDVELSKLNDNMFKYLPFKKAFRYNYGESSGSRLNLIKFWFDTEGNYLKSTGVANTKPKVGLNMRQKVDDFRKHQDIEDYKIIKRLNLDDLNSLDDGTPICFLSTLPGYEDSKPVVSFLYKYKGKKYLFQNAFKGEIPPDNFDYKVVSDYSCTISKESDYQHMLLQLELKKYSKENDNYNVKYSKDYKRCSNDYIEESSLSSASFAIILDLNKLSSLSKKSDKIKNRKISKAGAISLLKNDDIKKLNIDRYFSKIIDNAATLDISKTNSIFRRLLCGKNIIYLLFNDDYLSDMNVLIDAYYKAIIVDTETSERIRINFLLNRISRVANSTRFTNDAIKNQLDVLSEVLSKLKKDPERYEKAVMKGSADIPIERAIGLLTSINNLGSVIFDKLTSNKLETIEDLEILLYKMRSIKLILSSTRSSTYKLSSYFIEGILGGSTAVLNRITNSKYVDSDFESGLERVKTIIAKA